MTKILFDGKALTKTTDRFRIETLGQVCSTDFLSRRIDGY
jgi:hypothetical protein